MSALVQYFAVCGLEPGAEPEPGGEELCENPRRSRFRPQVLCWFPEHVEGHAFDQDAVAMLCCPSGLLLRTRPEPPHFHSFLITREDFTRTYGFVLTFYEQVRAPQISSLQSHCGSCSASSSSSMDSLSSGVDERAPPPADGEDCVFVSKALCVLTTLPFVNASFSLLSQLHRAVVSETPPPLPLESYVYNVLYEVPRPAPGRSLRFHGVFESIVVQRPGLEELPLAEFPLEQVFSLLGLDNTIQVFTCVLLELQVLLYSHDPQRLMAVAEALSSLLFPFQWQHVYVPILPSSLHHFLDAPVPYLMGLQGREGGARSDLELPQEANLCFVDIDDQFVDLPEDFPHFPHKHDLLLELEEVLQSPGPTHLQDQCNGNVDQAAILDLLQKNETLEKLQALATRTGVDVGGVNTLRAALRGQRSEVKSSRRVDEERATAVMNVRIREVFAARFLSMFSDYETFIIHSASDLQSWLTAREQMHNFDKASFLSEQPEPLLPFLSRFIETQMFASFIDSKIMSQWEPKEPFLRVFDLRLLKSRQQREPQGAAYRRCTGLEQAALLVDQRFLKIDHTAVLPHLLNMKIGEGRFSPGVFPTLQQDVLKAPSNLRWILRSPAPSSPQQMAESARKAEPRLDNELRELSAAMVKAENKVDLSLWDQALTRPLRPPIKSFSASCLQLNEALGKTLRQPKLSDLSPDVIAQTNCKFVEGLLKECRIKTKRLLVSKMGGEAVELGHGDAALSGLEENTLIASLCDLLERIWSHGLMVKQGKSSLWSHLLHYQAREERLAQQEAHRTHDAERRRSDASHLNSPRLALLQDIRHVQLMCEIRTDVGRARAWIRLSLEKKSLSQHLGQLLQRHGLTKKLYKRYAFLRCDDEKEQFLLHLLSLNTADYLCFTHVYSTVMVRYHVAIVQMKSLSNSLLTSNPWVCVSGDLRDSGVQKIPKNLLEMSFQCQNLGKLTTVQIGHDNSGLLSNWHVDCVLVRNEVSGHTYRFPCGRWLGKGVDDGSLERVLIGELLPPGGGPGGGPGEAEGRGCGMPPQMNSPAQARRVSLSNVTARGHRPTAGQIQDALGEVVNDMIKYFHKPEKERRSLTLLLCGDNGLVSALEQFFYHGFKSSRIFHKTIFVWDFVEKAVSHLDSVDRDLRDRDLRDRDQGRSRCSLSHYVKAIGSSSRSVGKDGKFQLLMCLGSRDRAVAQWLPLLADCPVTPQFYEDWALLRDVAAVQSQSEVLATLHEFNVTVEASLIKGVRL